jgi:Ca-activated chloride channel homolog
MARKPKPFFWIVVILVCASLTGLALYRMGFIGGGEPVGGETADIRQSGGQSEGGTIELAFYSSSAKKNWIDEMTARFNGSGRAVAGKTIRVKAYHVTSGGSLDQLKDGGIKPDMWSPGDESWLVLAENHWRNVKQKSLFDKYDDLVNIPLVIAMWEPMAKALGYPSPIGWHDIADLAAGDQGWAAHGHPEWGRFRWGHAHPDANSGFLTMVSEVYAALGKTDGITTEDLKNPEVTAFLQRIEGAVEHYGLSNDWIDDLMRVKGPQYLSAAVQYENTIIESNLKHENKPFKLVAIYPKEGNFWTRHPVAILKEDWTTPEKEAACREYIDFLLGKEAQTRAMEMGLRPIRTDIAMAEPFTPANGVQEKINSDLAYRVPEESVLRRIRDLWEDVKIPATVALVLDRSGSMKGPAMDNAKTGAMEFIRSMKPRDQIRVVVFNQDVTPATELCSIRDCGETLIQNLGMVFADGKTALYDAVWNSVEKLNELRKTDPKRRYSILVLSDGQDTASAVNRFDFLDALPKGEDYDFPKIYTIAYGDEADRSLLAEISTRTNGRLFKSNPDEIMKTYKELSANF